MSLRPPITLATFPLPMPRIISRDYSLAAKRTIRGSVRIPLLSRCFSLCRVAQSIFSFIQSDVRSKMGRQSLQGSLTSITGDQFIIQTWYYHRNLYCSDLHLYVCLVYVGCLRSRGLGASFGLQYYRTVLCWICGRRPGGTFGRAFKYTNEINDLGDYASF